jgi:threonine dehydratase
MIPAAWIGLAQRRIESQVVKTPLTWDPDLDLFLKWENRQVTGSFKIRGALNKVLSLEPWERMRGLVTASAGNHGQGMAFAARAVGVPAVVFASDHAVAAKVDAMRALGAEVRLVDGGYEMAEHTAQVYAADQGLTWISPYNDGQVIAGQATVGLEIIEQLKPRVPGAVIVPVGGGGLIAGIAAAVSMDGVSPRPKLIGAQSTASPFFHALFYRGTQQDVVEQESLADGLAGAVEDGSLTIPMVRRLVSEITLVSEDMIERAVAYAWQKHGEKIEGSAAVPLAAVMAQTFSRPPGPLVAVISGGNIQPQVHARICAVEI